MSCGPINQNGYSPPVAGSLSHTTAETTDGKASSHHAPLHFFPCTQPQSSRHSSDSTNARAFAPPLVPKLSDRLTSRQTTFPHTLLLWLQTWRAPPRIPLGQKPESASPAPPKYSGSVFALARPWSEKIHPPSNSMPLKPAWY